MRFVASMFAMMPGLGLGLLIHLATAQTTGSVVFIAATPARIVATAGKVTCTMQGNPVPSTAVLVTCQLTTASGRVQVGPHTKPIPPGASYTFNITQDGDAVGAIFSVPSGGGPIAWQVAATPAGGTAQSASGTLP